nr:hypothetical protein BaRGS_022011 [Batillaria attramentaria]
MLRGAGVAECGGRCVVTKQVDRVDNGVFYAGHKVTPDGDIRWDRMIVLDTDYVSTAAVVYEVFINGVLSDEDSELVLLVRDYDRTLNMTAVAGGLERFCGPQAASADVFQIHAFNWKAGCGNYEVKLG